MQVLKFRGKVFSNSDIRTIKSITKKHFKKGRTFISKKVCEELNWKQPNGWLKDRACRDVLRKLESMEILKLPEPKVKKTYIKKERKKITFELVTINELVHDIELKFAKGNSLEPIWNSLVQEFHYLGHSILVGKCIKYLVYSKNVLLGAISFSSPVKNVGVRNEILLSLGIPYQKIDGMVINNSRFLILPHVKVKNLASKILSMATKQIVIDWQWYYSQIPIIVETFVQISKFNGTCYKAANWTYLGDTKGFSKKGETYYMNNEPKYVFVYGLNKKIRQEINSYVKESLLQCKS